MTTESARPTGQLSQGSHDASTERALILEVLVEQPGAPCNLYQYDRERRALVLEQVLRVEKPQPADLARYPLERPQSALERIGASIHSGDHASGAEQAPAVPVLLLSTVTVAPGTWVSARLIGAMRAASNHDESLLGGWFLLAVPTADASQEQITTTAQIKADLRAHLAATVASQEPLENDIAPGRAEEVIEWLEAPEAARLVRQARATWRQWQRQQQTQTAASQGPREHLRIGRRQEEPEQRVAWRAIQGITLQQIREQGLGAYAEAEHLLRFVPQRFQQYLEEVLLDDERVLCFIERLRLRLSRGLLGLGARYLNEGLLLCTDRQVLWLRDVAASDATLVPWGYVARSCPVERLAGVHLAGAGWSGQ